MPIDAPDVVHLRGGGVSFAVETRGPHLPRVLHWGADTATTVADADEPRRLSVLPT
jgi:alpha-galactosidase